MKKYYLFLLLTAFLLTGCSQNTDSSQQTAETSAPQEITESETESLPPPTNAPFPEADPNAVTFDDGNFSFVSVVKDDDTAVDGSLSVETIDGNAMLKFTDNSTNAENLDKAVQKIRISVGQLLRPDQLESVYRITFDLYAEAKDALFLSDDGEYRKVAGWIGGGGGTICADGNWYSFADFSASGINEFDLERSDACHVEFKFLLAESGKKWDSSVEDVNFSVMRWGMQNLSDFYLDNITFYDQEGNPIPLNPSEPETSAVQESELSETESSEEETVPKSETALPETETEAVS
ncbi:MAG: lipoprotein [Oscillospiraceae bacterium]|nr:lipoprotein [Oscillospiraceae bacterium]